MWFQPPKNKIKLMIESEIPLLGMKSYVMVQRAIQLFCLSHLYETIKVALPT